MIDLDGHTLSLAGAERIALGREGCRLAETARARMQQSRALVERVAGESRAVYGINTGFGPLSMTRVSPEELEQHQVNLLHHLSVGQGDLFSVEETRAIMVARANALARGYSGIRTEVVDLLLALLERGVLPEIPCEGSVGASGDLAPLAHMARLLVGLGHARLADGQRATATEALEHQGLKPVVLQCKEGLALVNGTSVMTALAVLAVREAAAVLSWAELLGAGLFQVLSASPEVLCEQLHKARGFRGQHAVAVRMADHLRTNPDYAREIDEHRWGCDAKPVEPGVEIQDPYSVRCVPQVLGAFQEALWHIESVVERELNASTDNPLVFAETGTIIHGGNFYGQQISMACDYLRIGMAKVALLLDRQLERLVNWRYSQGLPPLLAGGAPGLNSGFAGCQLLATSLAAECRLLANPASVQTIPTNANNQDVVSMGCISARLTRQQIAKVWKIAAVQAMALSQAADLRPGRMTSRTSQALHHRVRRVSARLEADRPLFEEIGAVTETLRNASAQEEMLAPRPAAP